MRKTRANRAFWVGLCESLPPLPALSVSEWAEEYRMMSAESCAEPGKYRLSRIPMQRQPMDDANNPDVSEIILQWAAQTAGKSEILNNICGYFIQADPSPQLFVQPTIELTEDYSTERISPMIRDTPVLKKLIRDPRSRDSGNTIKSKRYPGGSLAMVGANAPSGLAGRPRRVILLDEIDRYPASAGTEGDPCALADKRADAFPNAVKIKTSTPTVRGKSRIENLLEQSDRQEWHCDCPKCGREQVWQWAQVKWRDGQPETAYLECANERCKHPLTDAERVASVRRGRWRATKPFTGIRGYWINGINSLFKAHKGFKNRLHEMVADFLKAKEGGAETIRVWVNTFLAETYEEGAESIQPKDVSDRAETYFPFELPEAALLVIGKADVQKNRIEAEASAFGRDEECWAIQKEVFWGDTEKDEVWGKLDDFLLKVFKRKDGVELKVERAFIDMKYKPDRVLAFCKVRLGRGVFPCQGVNRVGNIIPPLLPAKPSRNNKARIPHWNVGVTVAKSMVYDRLMLPPGPRAMHFPHGHGYDEDHFKQLTSEVRKTRYAHGQAYSIFEKPNDSVRNEALDLAVYGLAALRSLFPINWDKLAENRLAQRPQPEEAEAAEPAIPPTLRPAPAPIAKPAPAAGLSPAARRFRPRGNWMSGGGGW